MVITEVRPPHIGAQSAEEVLEVYDLRLPGGIGDGGDPLCRHRCQHGIFRGPYAGQGEGDIAAGEGAFTAEAAVPFLNAGPQGAKSRQVQVNGPGTKLAAAGVGQLGLSHAAQNGAEEDHRGAHLPHQAVGHVPAGQNTGVHRDRIPLPLYPAAKVTEDGKGIVHIGEPGTVAKQALPPGQKGGCQNGQHTVFGPLDPD